VTVGFFPVRPAGIPVVMQVFTVENRGHDWGLRASYRRWTVARGLRRAKLVLTNSEWAKSALGRSRAPVIVSPEGLRHDLFKPDGPRGAPGVPGRYFLWASNFYPYKRVELALAAYAGLTPAMRLEFPFVLIGGDWYGGRERAEAEAARLGISGDVRFLGWVDDEVLPDLYRGAVAHVLSTAQETFGRSVLESMACGCPNVIQDLAVLREVASGCAVFVDFADVSGASRALGEIAACGDVWARIAADGVTRASQFSFERLAGERVGAILDAIGAQQP
jgi:alpha-1,3-rhamnosyl/mannosyltransferase